MPIDNDAYLDILLEAEEDAEDIVSNAREYRTKKLQSVRTVVEREVQHFRERLHHDFEMECGPMLRALQSNKFEHDTMQDIWAVERCEEHNGPSTRGYVIDKVVSVELELSEIQKTALRSGLRMSPAQPAEKMPPATPAKTPVHTTEVKPAAKPVEKPAAKPVEKPVEKPAAKPVEKTAEKPVEKPVEKPAETLLEKAEEKPAVKPVVPAVKPVVPAVKPVVPAVKPEAAEDPVPSDDFATPRPDDENKEGKRLADDGAYYGFEEFVQYYGNQAEEKWATAKAQSKTKRKSKRGSTKNLG
jgi:hypothetical protein